MTVVQYDTRKAYGAENFKTQADSALCIVLGYIYEDLFFYFYFYTFCGTFVMSIFVGPTWYSMIEYGTLDRQLTVAFWSISSWESAQTGIMKGFSEDFCFSFLIIYSSSTWRLWPMTYSHSDR